MYERKCELRPVENSGRSLREINGCSKTLCSKILNQYGIKRALTGGERKLRSYHLKRVSPSVDVT